MTTAAQLSLAGPFLSERAHALYQEQLKAVFRRRDRVFAWLLGVQWLFAVVLALVYSPYAWQGKVHTTHLHVYYALLFGGLLTLPPILFSLALPGEALTRHVVAIAQMMWSALLIHLTGGRIETHFHVFGSLAFLAYYRDWRVILTATLTVASDHLVRGLLWPESVYGSVNPEWWRFLEHAGWVAFEDIVLVMSILENRHEMRLTAKRQAAMEELNATVESRVVERTRELEASRDQFRELVETTKTIPFELDPRSGRFVYAGPQAAALLGLPSEAWLASDFLAGRMHPDERERLASALAAVGQEHVEIECRLQHANGSWVFARLLVAAVCCCDRSASGPGAASESRLRGVILDVTERRRLESELRQAQKLESVGRLAAGVAHEINTPVQFVSDSVHFVRDAFRDLDGLMGRYGELRAAVEAGNADAALAGEIARVEDEADLSYLLENVPRALERSLDGLQRVASIVGSMKEFAHPDQKEMASIDLNQAICSTLTIARNEYRYVAELHTDLAEIPAVNCLGGEVNQVVLNIVVNAAHAIGDVVKGTNAKGLITVRTRQDGDDVLVSIGDTGGGIPEHVRERIFDPFFTTKEVGKGTGQGLAIARSVVLEKHGGELWFETELGKGTTFFIRLPIAGKGQRALGASS
jgi:two-component system, NtrC family, sensor kinase